MINDHAQILVSMQVCIAVVIVCGLIVESILMETSLLA